MLGKRGVEKVKTDLKQINARVPVVLRALGDKCRFSIFVLIFKHKDLCVTDIANICGITASAASQHLRTLERLGLVISVKNGKEVCYEINKEDPLVKNLINFIQKNLD